VLVFVPSTEDPEATPKSQFLKQQQGKALFFLFFLFMIL
jgi:hypothetical protein